MNQTYHEPAFTQCRSAPVRWKAIGIVNQIFDAIKNGKKSNAIIGREALSESLSDFRTVVLWVSSCCARGVGICSPANLMSPSTRCFKYYTSKIKTMDVAHQLGLAVVKRIFDWSDVNSQAGFTADVRWTRSDGRHLGRVVERDRMTTIVSLIKTTSDEKIEEKAVYGFLVGIDRRISCAISILPVGQYYTAHIIETTVTKYATDQTDHAYALQKLDAARIADQNSERS